MYDFHTHFIPSEVMNWVKDHQKILRAVWIEKVKGKEPFLVINQKWGFELKETFVNSELYLTEQYKAGVAHSIISPIPQLFMYDFEPKVTSELSLVYNHSLSNWVKSYPNQLSALGTVPLNDPEKASDILRIAMGDGLMGAIIGPGVDGKMLSDDYFSPFFETADRLNAIVFIHPLLNEDPRLKKQKMANLIGVPWETTICATDLLLSGTLDRYPNIKFLLAHGGGFFPYQIGRIEKGFHVWNDVSSQLSNKPSEYLSRFWYDTVLWNPSSLDFLLKVAGEDRVVSGSDFPFDLCTWPPANIGDQGAKSLLYTEKVK